MLFPTTGGHNSVHEVLVVRVIQTGDRDGPVSIIESQKLFVRGKHLVEFFGEFLHYFERIGIVIHVDLFFHELQQLLLKVNEKNERNSSNC